MSVIDVKYSALIDGTKSVEEIISELLLIVNDINIECKSLNEENVWQGIVADKFQDVTKKLYSYAMDNVLVMEKTNLFKNNVANYFKNTEKTNMDKYNV